MYFCQLTSSGSLIRHGKPQKKKGTRWVMANRGVCVCEFMCRWVG